jgi:hypothetical protein
MALALHGESPAMIRRVHELEIDQDLRFQRRSWVVQRVGWVVMAALIALAAAGLLGSGPLSHQKADGPSLRVEYERFARYQTSQGLKIHVAPGVTPGPEARVWVGRDFLDGAKIETIVPPPARVESADDRLVYVFSLSRHGGPLTVSFMLQSEHIGSVAGRVGIDGGETANFRQFVYP